MSNEDSARPGVVFWALTLIGVTWVLMTLTGCVAWGGGQIAVVGRQCEVRPIPSPSPGSMLGHVFITPNSGTSIAIPSPYCSLDGEMIPCREAK